MESAETTRTLTSSILSSAAHDRASCVSVIAAVPCCCALAGADGGREAKTAARVVPVIRDIHDVLYTAYLLAANFMRRFEFCVHSCRPNKFDPRQILLEGQVRVLLKCIILRIKTVTGKQIRSIGA